MDEVNLHKLYKELIAAGLPIDQDDMRSPDGTKATLQLAISPNATQQQRDLAAAILAAHDPTDFIALNKQDVLTRLRASALWGMTPPQIFTAMQGQVDGWTSLAQAKADLRIWLPLMAAAIFWLVSDQS